MAYMMPFAKQQIKLQDADDSDECLTTEQKKIKDLYAELSDKDQALIMAAQFGNNLIEEKENLERQMESNKHDQQQIIEKLEQESYELKRQLKSMCNEYEAKIYDLTEDCNLLKRQLVETSQSKSIQQHDQNEKIYLIEELTAKNERLLEEIKANELKSNAEVEKAIELELKLEEKDHIQNENTKLLHSFQKEINVLMMKQQELEFSLMQTCSERDKQTKLIEELTKKYLFVENEKNEIEHLLFQHENEIFNLRKVNQELIYKFEKIELHSDALNRKRSKDNPININNSSSLNNNDIKSHLNKFKRNNNIENNQQRSFSFESAQDNSFQNASSPFRQIENSNYYHSRSELHESDNDLDAFKMNEIEEDDDCEDLDDADESVDMYKNSAFLGHASSEQFLTGAINWQQEAIEQKICEDEQDENEDIRCDDNQNDNSDYSLNQVNEEDDSNNSLN